jgi:hypothetical protein
MVFSKMHIPAGQREGLTCLIVSGRKPWHLGTQDDGTLTVHLLRKPVDRCMCTC